MLILRRTGGRTVGVYSPSYLIPNPISDFLKEGIKSRAAEPIERMHSQPVR